ncbi:glutathionylspermidine synthase family protein [Streptomyces sp. KL116D]|uniref:glutathionylspermidine synthase family protein n=1 Tax=Streptomyces sp. KL116D TaxID=3045152 RepID=UPI00355678C6
MTVAYLRETAEQAGLETDSISMEDIGWDRLSGRFVDKKLRFIRSCFKLYPGNGSPPTASPRTCWAPRQRRRHRHHSLIEPAWKMLLSNKALLAVLWELFPGHPNLLPAYLTARVNSPAPRGTSPKPLLGARAGVTIHEAAATPTDLPAREEACCYQELRPCPTSTAAAESCSARGSSRTKRPASAST